MLDIKFIRENKDLIDMAAKKKHINFDVEKLILADDKRREIVGKIDALRAEQNILSDKIPLITDSAERSTVVEQSKEIKAKLQTLEDSSKEIIKEWKLLMLQVPNIPDMSVPDGDSDADNQEIKAWGEKTKFDFEPKSHVDIMQNLDMVDFERGAKVHGFRGYYLKNDGARLSWAIWNYANEFFGAKGFIPILPPAIVKKENLYGTGHLPNDAEDVYNTQDEDYLIGTAEVSVTGYHSGEVLSQTELPKKYLGFSPCFRREAGSYGKDTKGLIPVHEFY